jgi:TolB-like protein
VPTIDQTNGRTVAEDRVQRRLAGILAVDVAGYSRLMGADEEGTLAGLKSHRRDLLDPKIAEHRGRIVKTTGDGLLAEFASVVDALRCAVEVQRGMSERNSGIPQARRIEFRVGLNAGDIMIDAGDIYGDGVNVAARLEALAEPGGICVSGRVHEDARGKLDCIFDDLGEQSLKNIAAPVRVYRVRLEGNGTTRPAPALPDKPSIAVLPFDNMSGDPEQQYFSDGIAEDITTDLSKLSGLFVIARNSSFTYRGRAVNVQQVCRELGVRYLLEGSVRKAGGKVRIATQLIDGMTGGHLWAERYDRDVTDIFAVQDEVTREIVANLAVKLTPGEERRRERRGTDSLEAYDYFLRGRQLQWRRSREPNREARPLLERAIELDPKFVRAYCMLANVHVLDYVNRWSATPETSLDTALHLAQRAIELDDDEPEAHVALGLIRMREHDRAMAEARRALSLDPNHAWAYSLLGQALHYSGHSQEAIEPLETAIRLDPNDQDPFLHHLALAYFGVGRYADAVAALKRRIIRKPDTDISRALLAASYGHLERVEEAKAEWRELMRVNPDYSLEHRRKVQPYKDPADFERIVDGLRKAGLPE